MTDRLKRMINALGYKVWPAEVEALMNHHPAIHEVCVIGAKDDKRDETVKAVIVLKPDHQGVLTTQQVIDCSHEHMAAYKSLQLVEFVDHLPKSGTGKIYGARCKSNKPCSTANRLERLGFRKSPC